MLTSQAGADFVRARGDIVDLPEPEATRFVAAGIAEPVTADKPARQVKAETTAKPSAKERATKR